MTDRFEEPFEQVIAETVDLNVPAYSLDNETLCTGLTLDYEEDAYKVLAVSNTTPHKVISYLYKKKAYYRPDEQIVLMNGWTGNQYDEDLSVICSGTYAPTDHMTFKLTPGTSTAKTFYSSMKDYTFEGVSGQSSFPNCKVTFSLTAGHTGNITFKDISFSNSNANILTCASTAYTGIITFERCTFTYSNNFDSYNVPMFSISMANVRFIDCVFNVTLTGEPAAAGQIFYLIYRNNTAPIDTSTSIIGCTYNIIQNVTYNASAYLTLYYNHVGNSTSSSSISETTTFKENIMNISRDLAYSYPNSYTYFFSGKFDKETVYCTCNNNIVDLTKFCPDQTQTTGLHYLLGLTANTSNLVTSRFIVQNNLMTYPVTRNFDSSIPRLVNNVSGVAINITINNNAIRSVALTTAQGIIFGGVYTNCSYWGNLVNNEVISNVYYKMRTPNDTQMVSHYMDLPSTASGTTIISSSGRLYLLSSLLKNKENIAEASDALIDDTFNKFNIVSFQDIHNHTYSIGFILDYLMDNLTSDEIKYVCIKDDEGNVISYNQQSVMFILFRKCQMMNETINDLTQRIEALENK